MTARKEESMNKDSGHCRRTLQALIFDMEHVNKINRRLKYVSFFLLLTLFIGQPVKAEPTRSSEKQEVSIQILTNQGHYLHVTSADGTTNYARLKYPDTILRWSLLSKKNRWGSGDFGVKPFVYADIFMGSAFKQSLEPDHSNKATSLRELDRPALGSRLYIGLDLSTNFWKNSNYPVRIFGGIKYLTTILGDAKIRLTHAPNRNASCATAVQDSLLNPDLSVADINTYCNGIPSNHRALSFMTHFGVDWTFHKTFKLTFYGTIPIDYTARSYRIHEDPTINLGLGWIY